MLLTACSGYRFSQQDNPLAQYGIQSLSVPMFYNYSNLPEVQAEFTRETYRLLTGFSRLKLINGYKSHADAVMIGIVKSPEKMAETIKPSNLRVAQETAQTSLGGTRRKFYIPGTSDVQLYLHMIVIKKPTEDELTLLKSGFGDQLKSSSKIVFNEVIPLRIQYTREVMDGAGTQVIATQNQGVQRKIVKSLAEQAANSVRDIILYAF